MHKLKDIKSEIQQQHLQLAFNQRELNLHRMELRERFQQGLRSRGLLLGTFTGGLLLGWLARPGQPGEDASLFKGLKAASHWLTPVKSLLLNGLIRTAAGYASDRARQELRENA